MNLEVIQQLFNYQFWAFEKTWFCIFKLTDQQFTQSINYSWGSIRNQMVHTMSATNRWIDRLSIQPLTPHFEFNTFPSPQSLHPTWKTIESRILNYVTALDDTALNTEITWQLPNRNLKQNNILWEILLHVANHLMDHRTQIFYTLNQEFKIDTPEQDLLFYLVDQKKRSND